VTEEGQHVRCSKDRPRLASQGGFLKRPICCPSRDSRAIKVRICYYFVPNQCKHEMRKTARINLTVSKEVESYLLRLSEIGIHGTKPTEVASALVSREIERLVKEGFLKLKPTRGKP
jgi:hypothetical protein